MVDISVICHSSFCRFQGRMERKKENTRKGAFSFYDVGLKS